MKISVITVAFNSSTTIGDTISSFLEQNHPDKELIVIDGASTDDTLAVVKSFQSPFIRVFSESDAGPFDAMNKGLKRFDGDAAGFLNSDDTFHDADALTRIAAGLTEADIVYGDLDIVLNQKSKQIMRVWRAGHYTRRRIALGWMPPHPTFYARHNVLECVGEFNQRYPMSADYDFMLRAMGAGKFRVQYLPHVLVDFQLGGISNKNWRATIAGNLDCLHARRVHLGAGVIDLGLFMRPLRKLMELRQIKGYYKD